MQAFDIGVVGGGIIGASAALHAARRGAKVVLVDQAPLPNPRGASVDHSKVFRCAYPDPLYVRMAAEALTLWRDLERDAARELLVPTGLVLIGQGGAALADTSFESMRAGSCAPERLTPACVAQRWPQFSSSALSTVVFDPCGAIVRAEQAVRATLELARSAGVTVIAGDRITALAVSGGGIVAERAGRIPCANTLIATGPWSGRVLPGLASRLRVTRQEVLYFEPRSPADFAPERFPIFLELDSGFYGFPVHQDRAMKIANHQKGPSADPEGADGPIVGEEAARAFFRRFIPGLADARLVETRVCLYNNTPDDDFIIDWHPAHANVLIATGFSGHGFKFGPLIGRIVAEILTTGRSSTPLERFALARFPD